MTSFASMSLAAPLLRSLTEEGYTIPTPIQAQAIGPIMEGRDLLGCAQTGTGKTAAFALPILHRLVTQPVDKARKGVSIPRVLILSPTRELATQIGESFATYGRHTGLFGTVIFGGVSQFHQVRALHRGVDILVATPGRLIDLMEQRLMNFSAINTFVLDEADRMLDMGFIQPIRRIAAALPKERQTLLFSATMPKEIMHLADSLLRSPIKVTVAPVKETAALIEQSLYMVSRRVKQSLLHHMINSAKIERAVVFTKTKHGADKVAKRLNQSGIAAQAIHGNKAQNQRQRTLDAFREGRTRILVATDVAARGLDVDAISHVFNFDLPMEPEAYVHRIGRTGRAGASGIAVSFCDTEERGLLRDVERVLGKRIPLLQIPTDMPQLEFVPDREYTDSYNNSRGPRTGNNSDQPRTGGYGGGYASRGGSGGGSGGGQRGTRSGPRPQRSNDRPVVQSADHGAPAHRSSGDRRTPNAPGHHAATPHAGGAHHNTGGAHPAGKPKTGYPRNRTNGPGARKAGPRRGPSR